MMNEPVDLTAITTPFGLLDVATQRALKAHGGPYEVYVREGWVEAAASWGKSLTYRVRPAPVEPPKPRAISLRACPMCGAEAHPEEDTGPVLRSENMIDPNDGEDLGAVGYVVRCITCGTTVAGEFLPDTVALWNGEVLE